MKAIKTLGAALLAAGLLASVAPAGASARDFEGYVGCGRSKNAPEAKTCPQSREMSIFFNSLDATVSWNFCVKLPSGRSICSETVEAEQGHLYRQMLHPGGLGKYRITFRVEGAPIGSRLITVTR